MYSSSQKTIKDSIELDGVGLHNGKNVNICLKPAEVDTGIKFKRTDIDNTNNINRELPGYSAHDLSLSVNLKRNETNELKIKFHVANLFNTLYSSFGWTYPYISDYVELSNPYLVVEDDEASSIIIARLLNHMDFSKII